MSTTAKTLAKVIAAGLGALLLLVLVIAIGLVLMKLPTQDVRLGWRPGTPPEMALRAELERHVVKLAGDIGARNLSHEPEALERARLYVQSELNAMGFAVREQPVVVGEQTTANLIAEETGRDPAAAVIVLAAHYDSWERAPGANDNASGVSSLLSLARRLKGSGLSRSIVFAALTNEEPPFFKTESMGSEHFAESLKQAERKVELMLSLETMGYYRATPKTQHYPFPVGLLFPDRGDFIGLVSNISSRSHLRQLGGLMQSDARIATNGMALPSFITGVDWSDHLSFWKRGYSALMVTDTAPFRYPFYHTLEDTPDKLDYDSLTAVVLALDEGIRALAR